MIGVRRGGIVALALLLGACGGGVVPRPAGPSTSGEPPVRRPVAATPITPAPAVVVPGTATAAGVGLLAGPPLASLPISEARAARALAAFRLSCASLQRRADASGLTRGADWQPACSAATGVGSGGARGFFTQWFETVQVGDGKAFATGYFVPEIAGSRDRRPGYDTAHLRTAVRPGRCRSRPVQSADLKGKKIRGRVEGSNFVPYFDRTAIEQGALTQRARIIAWAADPVELFFLQIQGSGRLRLPDGSVMRIGYDSQNGRDYTGIGALMRQRGLLAPGQSSMQGIIAWLRDHPEEGRAIMRENKSYVFFSEQQTRGARRAGPAGDRRGERGRRSEIRAARCARFPLDGPYRRDRTVGRAGYRRCDPGQQPLRYLLGRGRRCPCDRGRHVGTRDGLPAVADRHDGAARGGEGQWRSAR